MGKLWLVLIKFKGPLVVKGSGFESGLGSEWVNAPVIGWGTQILLTKGVLAQNSMPCVLQAPSEDAVMQTDAHARH